MGPHLTLQAWSEESPAETGDHHPQYPGAAAADWECAAHRGNNVCHISVIICAVAAANLIQWSLLGGNFQLHSIPTAYVSLLGTAHYEEDSTGRK